MARINGDSWLLKLADDGEVALQIGYSSSSTLNIDQNMIETTNKNSSRNAEFIVGDRNFTLDFEGMLDVTASDSNLYSTAEMWDSLLNGTKLDWRFGSESSGDYYFSGEGYISSLSENAPHNDVVTYSGTLQVTGTVTKTEV